MIKSSTELIQHYDAECQRLEEKATPFNLYLEGYFEGMNDMKEYLTNNACEWLDDVLYSESINSGMDKNSLIEAFRKAMDYDNSKG